MISVFYTTYEGNKNQSRVGKALLGFVLNKYYDISIKNVNIERQERGKPYFADLPLFFSVSHSGGVVALAVSENEVGIDVEPMRDISRQVGIKYLGIDTDDKKILLREWIRRESYGKLTGEGFFHSGVTEPIFQKEYHLKSGYNKYYLCVSSRVDAFPNSCIFIEPDIINKS